MDTTFGEKLGKQCFTIDEQITIFVKCIKDGLI